MATIEQDFSDAKRIVVVGAGIVGASIAYHLSRRNKELTGTQKTLDNPKFVDRAPEAVVEQKRTRLAVLESEQEKLVTNLEMLG